MKTTKHTVQLRGEANFGTHAPAEAIAPCLTMLPQLIRASVQMAFEGRTSKGGRKPDWLQAATDMRFAGYGASKNGETPLEFELPRLASAAPTLFSQSRLFDSAPSPKSTALDVLSDALADIQVSSRDSERYDEGLLTLVTKSKSIFGTGFSSMTLSPSRGTGRKKLHLDQRLIESANELRTHTPKAQFVRVVGELDSLTNSTQRLSLLMRDGRKVDAVLTKGKPENYSSLFGKKVLIQGKAVYRPSGTLLRIDVEELEKGVNQPSLFEEIPSAASTSRRLKSIDPTQGRKRGAKTLFGSWPGDESEEELARILQEMS